MPNKFHNKLPARKGAPTGQSGGKVPAINEKTAAWPGAPGKTQPRDRSAGVKKVKQTMRSEGI